MPSLPPPDGEPSLPNTPTPAMPRLADRSAGVQWAILVAASAVFMVALEAVRLPAALLLGAMLGGILVAGTGGTVRSPPLPFLAAQAVIGCMIARGITPSIVGSIAANWPLFLGAVLAVVAGSGALGWVLARWQILPGTAAVWGSSPGAATPMILMAGAYGADLRLVAFMQYLRVMLVSCTASLVALAASGSPHGDASDIAWFAAPAWPAFAATLAIVATGMAAGRLRIPAGALLASLLVGAILQATGLLRIVLPEPLLAASYLLVGWNIGLGFTAAILAHAARAFPRVVCAILVQIAMCGALALLLVQLAGIEPLTAYLATSPGGADSVAIIAASAKVDVPFVMALQTVRMVVVLMTGPGLARFIAGRLGVRQNTA